MRKIFFTRYILSKTMCMYNIFMSLSYIKDLKFFSTGYGFLVNLYARIIGTPENWYEMNDSNNKTIMLYDLVNRTDIDWKRYYALSGRLQNVKDLTEITILDPYYKYSQYFDSIVLLPFSINQTTVF